MAEPTPLVAARASPAIVPESPATPATPGSPGDGRKAFVPSKPRIARPDLKVLPAQEFVIRNPHNLDVVDWTELSRGELLGEGAFSKVYKGMWNYTPVAVKVPKKYNTSNASSTDIKSFVDEVSILSQLHHHNIVMFMGACIDYQKGPLCIVTELLPGGNLSNRIHAKGEPIPFKEKLHILFDIASGLSYLHRRNFVHLDIKPQNVLLSPVNDNHTVYKIIDFGLSRNIPTVEACKTSPKGTINYMAPEALNGDTMTFTADVYSYGVLAWEVLTCQRPFDGVDRVWHPFNKCDEHVLDGAHMQSYPLLLRQTIVDCWGDDRTKRPSMNKLMGNLKILQRSTVGTVEDLVGMCKIGNLEEVIRLIDLAGVNPDSHDCQGRTPLYYAATCHHHEITSFLVNRGVSISNIDFPLPRKEDILGLKAFSSTPDLSRAFPLYTAFGLASKPSPPQWRNKGTPDKEVSSDFLEKTGTTRDGSSDYSPENSMDITPIVAVAARPKASVPGGGAHLKLPVSGGALPATRLGSHLDATGHKRHHASMPPQLGLKRANTLGPHDPALNQHQLSDDFDDPSLPPLVPSARITPTLPHTPPVAPSPPLVPSSPIASPDEAPSSESPQLQSSQPSPASSFAAVGVMAGLADVFQAGHAPFAVQAPVPAIVKSAPAASITTTSSILASDGRAPASPDLAAKPGPTRVKIGIIAPAPSVLPVPLIPQTRIIPATPNTPASPPSLSSTTPASFSSMSPERDIVIDRSLSDASAMSPLMWSEGAMEDDDSTESDPGSPLRTGSTSPPSLTSGTLLPVLGTVDDATADDPAKRLAASLPHGTSGSELGISVKSDPSASQAHERLAASSSVPLRVGRSEPASVTESAPPLSEFPRRLDERELLLQDRLNEPFPAPIPPRARSDSFGTHTASSGESSMRSSQVAIACEDTTPGTSPPRDALAEAIDGCSILRVADAETMNAFVTAALSKFERGGPSEQGSATSHTGGSNTGGSLNTTPRGSRALASVLNEEVDDYAASPFGSTGEIDLEWGSGVYRATKPDPVLFVSTSPPPAGPPPHMPQRPHIPPQFLAQRSPSGNARRPKAEELEPPATGARVGTTHAPHHARGPSAGQAPVLPFRHITPPRIEAADVAAVARLTEGLPMGPPEPARSAVA